MDREPSQDEETEGTAGSDSAIDLLMRRTAVADQLAPFLPGMVIGDKYRIDGKLGRGGMGAVYQATHVVSRKQVALKCMLRSAADEIARARFIREAQAAACIDHPNVVNVYDVGQEHEYCFLVMELLHGETLGARLKREQLGVTEALDLLMPAMRGVSAIHRAGVIHRDLKPENIFLCVSPDGSQREAKVLDFGISALPAQAGDWSSLTADGAILGTPAYMSPEQVQSARDLDETTDIYSFGVILYEALAGKTPYAAQTPSQLVLEVVHTAPRPLRELRPELPVELERVVLRALEKAREKRFQSIDALIEALLPYTTRPELGASSARTTLPIPDRDPRHVRTGILLLAGSIAALAGIAVVAERMDRASHNAGVSQVASAVSMQSARVPPPPSSAPVVAPAPVPAPAVTTSSPPTAAAPEPPAPTPEHNESPPSAAPALVRAALAQTHEESAVSPLVPAHANQLVIAGAGAAGAGAAAVQPGAPVGSAVKARAKVAKPAAQPNCDLDYSIDPSGRKVYRSECRP
ncbi:MAG: serine/threonine-protein kinase [Polyangiales bacterium]